MEKGFDTLSLVLRHKHVGYGHGSDYQSEELCEHLQVDASEEDHHDPNGGKNQRASQVLLKDDDDNRCGHDAGFDQSLKIV